MALRHPFPSFEIDPEKHLVEPERTPQRMPPPAVIEFRTAADLASVAQQVLRHQIVSIDAAVGSGKSTRLPGEIAKASGGLVVHTTPSAVLAKSLHDYVAGKVSVPVMFVNDVVTPLIPKGLVFMSCACLVARLISKGDAAPSPFTLYMDECHESDGCTYSLRLIAPCKTYVERMVLASATNSPTGFRKRETAGDVQVRVYDADLTPDKWDVNDSSKPWGADRIMDHTLIFVEQELVASRLAADYRDHGLQCFRITGPGTSIREFEEIKAIMNDQRQGIVVLLADYSYRSGHTLPVSVMIDGGEVAFIKVEGNAVSRHRRRTYAGEQEQAVGRVGRVAGTHGVAYVPAGDRESKLCELEGVESDAAALLMRYLGRKPPISLQGSLFFRGHVPADLSAALNSSLPLRMLAGQLLAEWPGVVPRAESHRIQVIGSGADSGPSEEVVEPVVEQVVSRVEIPSSDNEVSMHAVESSTSSSSDVYGSSVATSSVVATPVQVSSEIEKGFSEVMAELQPSGSRLEWGKYYYYPGVSAGLSPTMAFPEGLDSVVRMFDDTGFQHVARSMSFEDKQYAISSLLGAYNHATADAMAVRKVIAGMSEFRGDLVSVADRQAFREWLLRVAEVLTVRGAQISTYARALLVLAQEDFELMDDMDELESQLVKQYLGELAAHVRKRDERGLSGYKAALLAGGKASSVMSRSRFADAAPVPSLKGQLGSPVCMDLARRGDADIVHTYFRREVRIDYEPVDGWSTLWTKFRDKIAKL